MNRFLFLPCLLFWILCFPIQVLAADRVAFVVGIDEYPEVPLENAVQDATAVSEMLVRDLGFKKDAVFFAANPDRLSFFELFGEFSKAASEADLVLFYYAGHGMESIDGRENFLLPVDADVLRAAQSEAALRATGINLLDLGNDLARTSSGAKLLLLDCCRERPAGRSVISSSGGGLAQYEDSRIPADTLMLIAAAPDRIASDGEFHGPFTEALLNVLPRKRGNLMDVFFEVSDHVKRQTNERQIPWIKFDGSGQIFRALEFLSLSGGTETSAVQLESYSPWKKEEVSAFQKILIQGNQGIEPIYTMSREYLMNFSGQPSLEFQTKDGEQHEISHSEWLMDTLFRHEIARELPLFSIANSAIVSRIHLPAAATTKYSYRELSQGRAKLAELAAEYSEKRKRWKEDVAFELDQDESTVLRLGENISSFEYLLNQFGFAMGSDLAVSPSILPEPLVALADKIEIDEMLEKMPEMTREQLVQMIRQSAGETEDEKMFSHSLRLFFFYASSGRGLALFPPPSSDNSAWYSVGDLMLAALESKEIRPAAIERIRVLKDLVRAAGTPEFESKLRNFADFQSKLFPAGKEEEASQPSNVGQTELVFDKPENWKAEKNSTEQDLHFSFGPAAQGECSLGRLRGPNSGKKEILNRWREEMGLENLTNQEISELPQETLFGQPATLVHIDGDLKNASTGEISPHYRLVGLILTSEAGAIFVRMTGPRLLVAENEDAFNGFVRSLDIKSR